MPKSISPEKVWRKRSHTYKTSTCHCYACYIKMPERAPFGARSLGPDSCGTRMWKSVWLAKVSGLRQSSHTGKTPTRHCHEHPGRGPKFGARSSGPEVRGPKFGARSSGPDPCGTRMWKSVWLAKVSGLRQSSHTGKTTTRHCHEHPGRGPKFGARSSGPEVRGPKFGARSWGPDSCGTGMLQNILPKRYHIRVHMHARLPHAIATKSPGSTPVGARSWGPDSCGTGMLQNMLRKRCMYDFYMPLLYTKLPRCAPFGARSSGPEVGGPTLVAQVCLKTFDRKGITYEVTYM